MPLTHRSTLTQFLIEERRRFPGASGDFNALILDVAIACKAIARAVAMARRPTDRRTERPTLHPSMGPRAEFARGI